MGDYESKNFNSTFDGLVSTAYILAGTAGTCLLAFETVRQLRRRPIRLAAFWRPTSHAGDPAILAAYPNAAGTTPEDWHAAHMYFPRTFHPSLPAPAPARWPLTWIPQALWLSDRAFASRCGLDAALYVRFLRACTYWCLLHTFTTAPTLMAIHMTSATNAPDTDMTRASISSLVNRPQDPSCEGSGCVLSPNPRGRNLLFVHLVLLWWMSITWVAALLWIGWGILRLRYGMILQTSKRLLPSCESETEKEDQVYEDTWSSGEKDARARETGYAATPLHPFLSLSEAEHDPQFAGWRVRTLMVDHLPPSLCSEGAVQAYFEHRLAHYASKAQDRSPVQEVVLVYKRSEQQNLLRRWEKARDELEKAHIRLVNNVLSAHKKNRGPAEWATLPPASLEAGRIWDTLYALPRDVLATYHPQVRVQIPTDDGRKKSQKVPLIDYWTTRYNYLSYVLALPCKNEGATSTAFVTFRDPRQARLLLREMRMLRHPTVLPAPEARDLDWSNLGAPFSSSLIWGKGTGVLFWAFTLLWIFPLSIVSSVLANVQTLKTVFPGVEQLFERFPRLEAWISVTLPSLLVSLLNMLVPEMLFQLTARGQDLPTRSKLYDTVLCRYWKFTMITSLLFFTVGTTALKSALIQVGNKHSPLLNSIAFSFPAAAPFFVSYLMLTMATQSSLSLVQLIMGVVRHVIAVRATTPRGRFTASHPRPIYASQWLPQHLLIMAVLFVFTLLNPLVLPFSVAYWVVALTVFKRSFGWTFLRTYAETNGAGWGVRILRFSLDSLLVGQSVFLIFLSVTKERALYLALTAVLLPLTVLAKLVLTRLFRSQVRYLDDLEANARCGIPLASGYESDESELAQEHADAFTAGGGSWGSRAPRADGRFPPVIPAMSGSGVALAYHRFLELWCANGHDLPGLMIWLFTPARRRQVGAVLTRAGEEHSGWKQYVEQHGPVAWMRRWNERRMYRASVVDGVPLQIMGVASVPDTRIMCSESDPPGATLTKAADLEHVSAMDERTTDYAPLAESARSFISPAEKDLPEDNVSMSASASASVRGRSASKVAEPPLPTASACPHDVGPVLAGEKNGLFDSGVDDGVSVHDPAADTSFEVHSEPKVSTSLAPWSSGGGVSHLGDALNVMPKWPVLSGSAGPSPASHTSGLGAGDKTARSVTRPHHMLWWEDQVDELAHYYPPSRPEKAALWLWLPRNPARAGIDLCDTVELRTAVTSCVGGILGQWEVSEGGSAIDAYVHGHDHNGGLGAALRLHVQAEEKEQTRLFRVKEAARRAKAVARRHAHVHRSAPTDTHTGSGQDCTPSGSAHHTDKKQR